MRARGNFLQNPSPTLATTTLLLERLRDDIDDEAWREFDARFRGVILSAALRLGLEKGDAEDVAQETMLQAFRDYRAGKYDRRRGRLSSWLISIAHHRIVDAQRRMRRDGRVPSAETPDRSRTAEAFDRALERRVFEEAWDWLSGQDAIKEESKRAFELTALRGVPVLEAAAQCGMTADQVYVARNRVSAKLRDAVELVDRAYRDGL